MTAFDAYDAPGDGPTTNAAEGSGRSGPAQAPLEAAETVNDERHAHASASSTTDGAHRGFSLLDAAAGTATKLDAVVGSALKSRLHHGRGVFTTHDPEGLSEALDASHRFRRDTRLGSLFHHPKISFREVSRADSLHVVIDGNTVSSHIDRISPLNCNPERTAHYSPFHVVAHNATGFVDDVVRLLGLRRAACHVPVVRRSYRSTGTADQAEGGAPRVSDETTLPFSIIDEAIHLLESEAAPWSIQLEVRVSGTLDEERLRAAVVQALGQHPMARARKRASRRVLHRDVWEIPAECDIDPLRVVTCGDDRALDAARSNLQSLGVPLAESPPMRLRLARHRDGDVVMMNVNHAAMDGLGALRVLRSIARAYSGDVDPVPAALVRGTNDLPSRGAAPKTAAVVRRHLALIEKLGDLIAPPARLAVDDASGDAGYGFFLVALSNASTSALIEFPHPGTVNDLLLAALHESIDEWNARHGAACGRIAVLVPANLRPRDRSDDQVGNFSLPARVATCRRGRADAHATLDKVTAVTSRKKRTGMGTALVEVLAQSYRLPLWAKQTLVMLLPVTGDRMVDTAMMSNLGALDETPSFGADGGEVTEMWFSPPARMPLGLVVGAVTVGGRLHLSFRYRHRQFGPGAGEQFARLYLEQLGHIVGSAVESFPALG